MASTATPLVNEQHKELLAHDALEFAERHATTGLFAHAAQEVEPALIENALGQMEVQQRADRRFARTAIRYAGAQLLDAPSNQREMRGVLAAAARRNLIRRP